MNLYVSDFSLTDPALVVLDPRVNFAVMFEHFGKWVKSERAIRAFVVLCIRSMTLSVSNHPFRFARPKGTSTSLTVNPLIIGRLKAEVHRIHHWCNWIVSSNTLERIYNEISIPKLTFINCLMYVLNVMNKEKMISEQIMHVSWHLYLLLP